MDLMHDGRILRGRVAIPDGNGPFPAVLVMHSALGLRDFNGAIAQSLAARGWLAVATDMYGADADLSSDGGYGKEFAAIAENPDRMRDRIVSWFNAVSARPDVDSSRIAAIGYCFGGQCVLELARSGADVKAVVSYHGLLTTHAPAQKGAVTAQIAAYCGGNDPYAPMADIAALQSEMAAAEVDLQTIVFSDAEHGFTDEVAAQLNRPGISYNRVADKVSWAGTLALLDEVLA